jgi:hypothetical protein
MELVKNKIEYKYGAEKLDLEMKSLYGVVIFIL